MRKIFCPVLTLCVVILFIPAIVYGWGSCTVEITGPRFICVGETITLTACGTPSGGSCSWSNTPGLSPSGCTATFKGLYNGDFWVTVTYSSGYDFKCSDVDLITVGGRDQDEDGHYAIGSCIAPADDCDDNDPAVHPGATETCDNKDNNCDGQVDEGPDKDGDGYAICDCNDNDPAIRPGAVEVCDGIDNDCDGRKDEDFDRDWDGWSTCMGDCDDTNRYVYPGATEICDKKDNNCDGKVDEGFDKDGDGYTTCGGDCNDNDPSINPGAAELCDGIDNDCDGLIDEDFDRDWDGWTTCRGDCDDTNRYIYPRAPERCNGIDDNCNGQIDEGFDKDNDGYRTCDGDCNDNDPTIYPGATEACDGKDNNCDGTVDEACTGCDPNSTGMGSSANLAIGNLYHSQTIFSSPIPLTFLYNSRVRLWSPFGSGGWTHNYNIKIRSGYRGSLILVEEDGKGIEYLKDSSGIYRPQESYGEYSTIIRNPDGTYLLTTENGTKYSFDYYGRLKRIEDRNGNAITLFYSSYYKLDSVTDSSGRSITLKYDSSSRIISITDPAGRAVNITYSSYGYPSSIREPSGNAWSYTYDSYGRMLTKTDPGGNVTRYTYDSKGRVYTSLDPSGKTKSIIYDLTNKTAYVTERDGGIWTYKYDNKLNVPLDITDPTGKKTTKSYDSRRNLISETDQSGRTTAYSYDSVGNIISVTDPEGNVTKYTYNSFGQITSIADPEGKTTTYSYDNKGNLLSITDPSGATSTFTYNTKGQILTTTDPEGRTTSYTYDNYGNISTITTPDQNTYTFTYDISGNLLSQKDSEGKTTTYEYDIMGNLIKITDPSGTLSQFTYDSLGRRTSSKDANGSVTKYEYDYKGRVARVIDAMGGVTTYTYGDTGCGIGCGGGSDKLTSVTDAAGNITRYEYDTLGRLIKEIDPEGKIITYAYDASGNLVSKTDANGITITYSYDTLNRLIELRTPNSELITYSYDSAGKVLTMTDFSGTTSYIYDNSNRLTSETKTIEGKTFNTLYSYTLSGALTSVTYPIGRIITYERDPVGRIVGVIEEKDGKRQELISSITYLPNGAVSSIVYGNGITTAKGYDVRGALSSLNIGNLKQFSYTRDSVGNITAINDLLDASKIIKTYSYDKLYRLTQAAGQWGTIQYNYDSVGNRTKEISTSGTTDYTYAANKLITSTGAKSFTFNYDNNGNTIAENQKQYTYNQNQRLIKVTDTVTVVLGEYLYNGNGQRVKKIANGRMTYYLYDQSGNLIEEADEQGQVNSDYIYLGNVPIVRVDEWWEGMKAPQAPTGVTVTPGDKQLTVIWNANQEPVDGYKVYWEAESGKYTNSTDVGKVTSYTITGLTNGVSYYITVTAYADLKELYYYHTDHLGTPIVMTDSNGSMVWEGERLPFGEEYSVKGKTTNNLSFPGQYFDVETGLYYNWHRYDDPKIGRFTTYDPSLHLRGSPEIPYLLPTLLYTPQELNPYVFTANNPVRHVDFRGLTWLEFDRGASMLYVHPGTGETQGPPQAFQSGNNVVCGSDPWPAGTYTFSYYVAHPESDENGPYGSNGNFVFNVPNRTGMGVHSGRANSGGPSHPTHGCIRTTDGGTQTIYDYHFGGDTLSYIIVR